MTTNWGMLTKSQTDDETIEEAIDRIVADHNNDPTSHLEVGQSLQSHKASAIIDHEAASIIDDKIKKFDLDPNKINLNSLYTQSQLESLDAWYQSHSGSGYSYALDGVGAVVIKCGGTNGNTAVLSTGNSLFPCYSEKDPLFQILVSDGGDNAHDISVCVCNIDPFVTNISFFGIKYLKSSNKVYGFVNQYYSGSHHETLYQLASGYPELQVWRAEWDHTNKVCRFYINGVLITTADVSAHYGEFDGDRMLAFGVKQAASYADAAVWFMNPIFNQKL